VPSIKAQAIINNIFLIFLLIYKNGCKGKQVLIMTQTNLIIRIKRKLSVSAAKPLYIGVAGNQEKEKKR
jgi:hypothetical protein